MLENQNTGSYYEEERKELLYRTISELYCTCADLETTDFRKFILSILCCGSFVLFLVLLLVFLRSFVFLQIYKL